MFMESLGLKAEIASTMAPAALMEKANNVAVVALMELRGKVITSNSYTSFTKSLKEVF